MKRMKIEMPDKWQFSTEIQVRIDDLNYGNHMGNQQFLVFGQEARSRFFGIHGFSELNFGGVSLIQADAAITYTCEGSLGDRVAIDIAIELTGSSSFDVYYKFTNRTKGKHMANLRTALVSFDYEKGKPVAIPVSILQSGLFNLQP